MKSSSLVCLNGFKGILPTQKANPYSPLFLPAISTTFYIYSLSITSATCPS